MTQQETSDPDVEQAQAQAPPVNAVVYNLYVSHFLSTWNTRAFEFGAVLFLSRLFPNSFIPSSLYAICRCLAYALLSHRFSRFVNVTNRLRAARISIVYPRLAVVASCLVFLYLAEIQDGSISTPFNLLQTTVLNIGLAIVIPFACIERLYAYVNYMVVERDWVKVISHALHGEDTKATETFAGWLNNRMRGIDLICKLTAPVVIGYIDANFLLFDSVLSVLIISALVLGVEYYSIARVYQLVPALHHKEVVPEPSTPRLGSRYSLRNQVALYVAHPMALPSISGCILYFTVLSFGQPLIMFLRFVGTSSDVIAQLRDLSVLSEASALVVTPWLRGRIGELWSGFWFVNSEAASLILGVFGFWYLRDANSKASIGALIAGVVLSRLGLFGFDQTVYYIVVNNVSGDDGAVFSGIEGTLKGSFELLTHLSLIVWSHPDEFLYPAALTAFSVTVSAMLYNRFVFSSPKVSKHVDETTSLLQADDEEHPAPIISSLSDES